VPVFGALLAVAILGEPFRLYHALAFILVLSGIWLAERKSLPGRRREADSGEVRGEK
jgi:drug/metabolite transporter (DMT)-like permease